MTNDAKNNNQVPQLTEIQHYVTQERGTERPYTGKLLHNKREGIYHCLCCNAPLFYSDTKYESGCGWPSFYQPVTHDAINYPTDNSHNMERVEIRLQTLLSALHKFLCKKLVLPDVQSGQQQKR